MPSAAELRLALTAAIADAIGNDRGQQQAWSERTGLDPAEIGRLARRDCERYSLQRLVNLVATFGLTPELRIVGVPKAAGVISQRRTRPLPEAVDNSASGRLSRTLVFTLANCIDATLEGGIDGKSWNQTDLAAMKGLTQSTISLLKNRRLDRFKLDSLVDYAPKDRKSVV